MTNNIKAMLVAGSLFLLVVITGIVGFAMYASANNREVQLRHSAEAAQTDLKNQLDLLNKKIGQTAQVSQAEVEALKGIVVGYASARGGVSSGKGAMLDAKAIHEAVPSITSVETLARLQNIIAGARDSYADKQTRLLDIKRMHDVLLDSIPSSWFVGGRPRIEVKIVSSTRVEEAFITGKDDDDTVFRK